MTAKCFQREKAKCFQWEKMELDIVGNREVIAVVVAVYEPAG